MIVLIADLVKDHKSGNVATKTLELAEKSYFDELMESLQKIDTVKHYDSISSFCKKLSEHSNDTVLSIWSGTDSRNRRAFVPSLCESHRIKYVGADAYSQIICQDKALAKEFAKKFGLNSPKYILPNGIDSIEQAQELKFPVIIKPNFEGGSIGISKDNICQNYQEVIEKYDKLKEHFEDLIIEEFVGGKEICIVLSGTSRFPNLVQPVEIYAEGYEDFFQREIFGLELKKINKSSIKIRQRGIDLNNPELMNRLTALYRALGKVQALRIDGKLLEDKFYMIELTTDIHYGSTASFAQAFKHLGFSYDEMVAELLINADFN